jgi:predicted murein hydrolase (TIGR00659 family)
MIDTITSSPLFGLVLTIFAFLFGRAVQRKTGWTLANPLVIATVLCVSVLLLFDIPYENYAQGGDIINMMLGPVTAVLALGIYNQYAILKQYFVPVLLGCTVGSLTSLFGVLGLCRLMGLDESITASLMPKSCTTPIALSIAESHGGLPAIAAAAVLCAGVTGAVGAPFFAKWLGITHPVAQGLATGACSHALGTTKAREMGELQGAMSSIAIGVCGLISVIIALFL